MTSSRRDITKLSFTAASRSRRLPGAGLVGIPLGLSARKGGKSTGFVLTILLVVRLLLLLAARRSLARQGKTVTLARRLDGKHLFLSLRSVSAVARRPDAHRD